MADNVIDLHPARLSADELLEELQGMFQDIVVVGWTADDNLAVAATKELSAAESYWLLMRTAQVFLSGD